jgi:hypothetical protein
VSLIDDIVIGLLPGFSGGASRALFATARRLRKVLVEEAGRNIPIIVGPAIEKFKPGLNRGLYFLTGCPIRTIEQESNYEYKKS